MDSEGHPEWKDRFCALRTFEVKTKLETMRTCEMIPALRHLDSCPPHLAGPSEGRTVDPRFIFSFFISRSSSHLEKLLEKSLMSPEGSSSVPVPGFSLSLTEGHLVLLFCVYDHVIAR